MLWPRHSWVDGGVARRAVGLWDRPPRGCCESGWQATSVRGGVEMWHPSTPILTLRSPCRCGRWCPLTYPRPQLWNEEGSRSQGAAGLRYPFFFFSFFHFHVKWEEHPVGFGLGIAWPGSSLWIWALTLGPKAGGTALRGGEARLGALRCRFLAWLDFQGRRRHPGVAAGAPLPHPARPGHGGGLRWGWSHCRTHSIAPVWTLHLEIGVMVK